jgi:hypothetical protein
MQTYQYVIDPQIAKVVSTKDYIPYFSLGQNLETHLQSSPSQIEVNFEVVKDFSCRIPDSQKFHFFYGYYDKDEIYYEKPLSIGVTLKMRVENLLEHPKITVNSSYYKYVRFKADNVYPPGIHLVDTLSVNLLKRMYAPLHCAAVSSPHDEGILLVAPPDTGKTLTTFLALNRGFSFLAEDIAFVDQSHVYANPYTSTFLHGDQFSDQKRTKSLFSRVKNIPARFDLLQYYYRPAKLSIPDLLKNVKVNQKARIKNIFILDKGKTSIQKLDPQEAFRRVLIVNRNEFSYYKNTLTFAYAYFNPSLDINKLMRAEENIINAIVSNNNCYLIKSSDPKRYIELISETIR